MKAAEFVNEMADRTGKPVGEVRVYDRVLADSGFRRKSSGRRHYDINLDEGLNLLLGMLVARVAIHADKDLADAKKFLVVSFDGEDAVKAILHSINLKSGLTTLSDSLVQLCNALSSGEINPEAIIEIEATPGGVVSINVAHDGQRGRVFFSGVTDHWGIHGFMETRTARRNLIEWVAQSAIEDNEAGEESSV